MFIYTTYDYKSETFSDRFYPAKNDEEAIRGFITALRMSPRDSIMLLYPEDFAFYRIGMYNDQSGFIVSEESPIKLISAFEAMKIIKSSETPVPSIDVEDSSKDVVSDNTSVAEKE